jgi:hypothetical protein
MSTPSVAFLTNAFDGFKTAVPAAKGPQGEVAVNLTAPSEPRPADDESEFTVKG